LRVHFAAARAWVARSVQAGGAYRGAAAGLWVAMLLASGVFLYNLVIDVSRNWLAIGLLVLLFTALACLAWVGSHVLRRLAGRIHSWPIHFLWALLAAFSLVAFNAHMMYWFYAVRLDAQAWASGLALMLFTGLIGAGAGTLCQRKGRPKRLASGGALVLGIAGLVSLIFTVSYSGEHIPRPAHVAVPGALVKALDLPDPSRRGLHAVQTYVYGSGTDLRRPEYGAGVDFTTRPVDGSRLIDGWSGKNKWLRDPYWGFDSTALPLNARVWAPKGAGPFPLVLAVHGNHTAESASEGGYAYLGELLASRGFIVASVDENFLNTSDTDVFWGAFDVDGSGLEKENDARGWLLLEHIRQFRDWNREPGHPFSGRVDLAHVGLIGHSRGGEAVAVAAAFNRLPAHPDDARIEFDYDFGIRAVVAIAAAEGQFEPSGVPIPLEDVSYFAIQGSHDSDIYAFQSGRQYERTRYTADGPWFKSTLYVYGANHSQFNAHWGGRDFDGLSGWLLNTRNLLPAAEQRRIAEVYISAFMEINLRGQSGYRGLFENHMAGRAWLPDTFYVNRYAAAGDQPVATFEEDIDLTTATLPGARLDGGKLGEWGERIIDLKEDHLGKAVILGWGQDQPDRRYEVLLPPGVPGAGPQASLVFSLADMGDEFPDGDARPPLEIGVEVVDADGDRASLPLSAMSALPPQMPAQVNKLAFLNPIQLSEPAFQSYRFPLAAFQARNALFDPGTLRGVAFRFDGNVAGRIAIDDIGLAGPR
jgi:dienelactone hydrolase